MRIISNINHNSEGLFKILLVCLNRYRAIICVWKRGAGQRAFFDLYGPQDCRNCGPKQVSRSKWPASVGQSAGQRKLCNVDGPQHRRNRGPEQFLKSRWPAKSAEPWAKRQLTSRMARKSCGRGTQSNGRWYYGHDHQYGCEFGGNRGSGEMD